MIRENRGVIHTLVAVVVAFGLVATTWAQAADPAPAKDAPVCPANEGRALPGSHPAMGPANASAPGAVCPATPSELMAARATGMPSATAPASVGSIDIQVNQGTQGGPAIGAVPVSVQLFQEGVPTQKFDLKLDATGHTVVANVQIHGAVEPVVIMEHAGLMQQTMGTAMDSTHPKSQIVMRVYETASTAPAWNIAMRHVIVHSTPEGLQVTEMLSVNNPTDRIWLGTTQFTTEHVTLALPVPAGIANLEVGGGFQDPYSKVVGDQLVSMMPMFPGAMEFQINYTVPVSNGAAEWAIAAPAAVNQLIVFAPADQSTVTVDGAKDSGTVDMGQGPMHMFRGAGIKAGQVVTLKFSGIVAAAAPAVVAAGSANWVRNIGAIGAVIVVVIGSGILLVRRPKAAKKA